MLKNRYYVIHLYRSACNPYYLICFRVRDQPHQHDVRRSARTTMYLIAFDASPRVTESEANSSLIDELNCSQSFQRQPVTEQIVHTPLEVLREQHTRIASHQLRPLFDLAREFPGAMQQLVPR